MKNETDIPKDFEFALEESKLKTFFMSLPPSHRKEYIVWIEGATKEDTRIKRIVKAIEDIRKKVNSK